MKVLVTGVAGFLGSHLAEKLASLNHDVVGIDNMIGGYPDNVPKNIKFHNFDCCDLKLMNKTMQNVDVVYHCAATAHEGLSVFSPVEISKNNYLATVSVITAAINNKAKRIIYCSSMARYGNQQTPFTEDMIPKPIDPYAISKVAAEGVLINLCDLNNIEWVIAVPHNIIGPRQKYDDPFRNVVSIMLNRMMQKKAPLIYGDGKQIRDWLYVDDHVHALMKVTLNAKVGETYNIGGNNEIQNIEVVRTVCSILDELIPNKLNGMSSFSELITYVKDRPGHDVRYAINANKINKDLGWEPQENFESGIRKTVEWYINNKAWCDNIQNGSYQLERLGVNLK